MRDDKVSELDGTGKSDVLIKEGHTDVFPQTLPPTDRFTEHVRHLSLRRGGPPRRRWVYKAVTRGFCRGIICESLQGRHMCTNCSKCWKQHVIIVVDKRESFIEFDQDPQITHIK